MRSKSIRPPLFLLSITLFLAVVLPHAAAQVTGATLSGTVTDPSGSVIPNARVAVMNASQGTERRSITNKSGDYTLPNVTPGLYSLRVEAQGFQTQVRTGLEFTVGQVETINLSLAVAGANETVTVES